MNDGVHSSETEIEMIELDTTKLQAAYPQLSEAQIENMTTRYLRTVSEVLWQCNARNNQTPQYQNALFFSTKQARDKLSYVLCKGQKIMVWDAMQAHCPALQVVQQGLKINRTYSEVKVLVDTELLLAIAGDVEELNNLVMKDANGNDPDYDLAHWVPIDAVSLNNYIAHNSKRKDRSTSLDTNLIAAKAVLKLSEKWAGYFPQFPSESKFGRQYYTGLNLQNCAKTVRNAALGDCVQYDLKTAVYAVMLNFAERIEAERGGSAQGKWTYLKDYVDHKSTFRKSIARTVFGDDQDWQVDIIKEAFTAIGFGARPNVNSWNDNGQYRSTALGAVFKSKERAKAFLSDSFVANFIEDTRSVGRVIYDYCTANEGYLATLKANVPDLLDKRGIVRHSKVLAYVFQNEERRLLNLMTDFVRARAGEDLGEEYKGIDSELLLTVHDGFYTRHKTDVRELRTLLKQDNPYLDVEVTEHSKFTAPYDYSHENMIALEEERAKRWRAAGGGSNLIDTTTQVGGTFDPELERNRLVVQMMRERQEGYRGDAEPAYPTDKECYDGSGYDGRTYNREDDPYYMDDEENED